MNLTELVPAPGTQLHVGPHLGYVAIAAGSLRCLIATLERKVEEGCSNDAVHNIQVDISAILGRCVRAHEWKQWLVQVDDRHPPDKGVLVEIMLQDYYVPELVRRRLVLTWQGGNKLQVEDIT